MLGPGGEFAGVGLVPDIDHESATVELDGRAQRIQLIIDVANLASRRVAERCGDRLEGTMRSIRLKQGRRIDAELWSRLPSDGYIDPPCAPA